MTKIYTHSKKVGIDESLEFQKKRLATHGLNVGTLCGHGCKYCSTAAMVYRNPIFKKIGMTSFEALQQNVAIVDPSTPERVVKQAARLEKEHIVMLSTTTDPYSPEAQKDDLGRKCAQAVLEHSQASLRILTKNAAVVKDLDLFAQHKARVLFGLSLTSTVSKEKIIKVLEPNASSISERLEAYRQAHALGIRTYAMLCPLLPGIASTYSEIRELMETVLKFEPEDIWVEPVNPRGNGLKKCSETLYDAGWTDAAFEVDEIQNQEMHQLYSDDLIEAATNAATDLGCKDKLKILVYSDGTGFCCDDSAVIWLKK